MAPQFILSVVKGYVSRKWDGQCEWGKEKRSIDRLETARGRRIYGHCEANQAKKEGIIYFMAHVDALYISPEATRMYRTIPTIVTMHAGRHWSCQDRLLLPKSIV